MTDEFALEFKRQAVHLLVGLFEAMLVFILKPAIGVYVLTPIAATILFLYYAPRIGAHLPGISHLITHFEREKDVKKFPFKGALLFNVGIIVPVALLETRTACTVITVLACGDAASTLVGKFWGTPRINGKSIEGFVAFIAAAYGGALLFTVPETAFMFALIGGFVELFFKVDDNLSIPISLTGAAVLTGL
ncbi:MAG: hypothetical protein ABH834_05625 [Candidatus Altiarchaeota archaeon]